LAGTMRSSRGRPENTPTPMPSRMPASEIAGLDPQGGGAAGGSFATWLSASPRQPISLPD
jgi:hypothetical protein